LDDGRVGDQRRELLEQQRVLAMVARICSGKRSIGPCVLSSLAAVIGP
jgi:hypothetical protein